MQIPQNFKEALWKDQVEVYRKRKINHVMREGLVYEHIPCHLSQNVESGKGTLYVDQDVKINKGDSLKVFHQGQVFQGIAAQPFYRSWCNVIPLEHIV